jgi:predicted transcriptional regulator
VASSSTEISKVQELVYELRVEQVMNRDVISISPNCSMRELEELLRIKRISGVPWWKTAP